MIGTKGVVYLMVLILKLVASQNLSRTFPDGFMFGVASSAYQIEGAWDKDGKTPSIWDHLTHTRPEEIYDRSNGDVACDSYHLYKEDISLQRDLGVDFYRFSMSWTRILPTGYPNYINPKGIEYYNNLIDELLLYNITPFVTIYHWDLPQNLQELGGWTNEILADHFLEYARVLFDNFGDRVKHWVTINEIQQICQGGYSTVFAPLLNMSGIADYLCTRTTLLAHAKVYHLYNDVYRSVQQGQIGLTTQSYWYEPVSNKTEDIEAAERKQLFHLGLFTDPIHSSTGDFPEIVKTYVANKSREQGYASSRLPAFTQEEILYLKGTADFFGLNYYSTDLVSDANGSTNYPQPSYEDDSDVHLHHNPDWIQSRWIYVVPSGLRKLINWISARYNKPEIFILENGYPDGGQMNDSGRVYYYRSHLDAILSAIYDDGCNVTKYTAWTLLDNFEWLSGYLDRFGLYYVDFNHPNKTRTPKASAVVYKEILRSRLIDWTYDPKIANVTGNSADSNIPAKILVLFMFVMFWSTRDI